MNKIFKLILVFVVVLGVIVCAATLPSLFDGDSGPHIQSGETFSKDIKKIESEWSSLGDWDKELFDKQLMRVNISKYSSSQKMQLQSCCANAAIQVVNGKILGEWGKADCQHATIKKYLNAINVICAKNVGAKTNENVKLIRKINGVYDQARELAASNFVPQAKLDKYLSWTSYTDHAKKQKNKVANVRGNSYYRTYMSNIRHLNNGLSEASVNNRINSGRSVYYANVAKAIVAHFKSKERTQGNLNTLRACRNQFVSEYGASTELNNFASQFADEVYNLQ